MDWADYLPLDAVEALVGLAEARGVSEVARAPGGFLEAFRAARGNPARLPQVWVVKRQGFLRRHVAQGKLEGWWEDVPPAAQTWSLGSFPDDEWPTRRHLALIMWAWSPDDAEVLGWLEEWRS